MTGRAGWTGLLLAVGLGIAAFFVLRGSPAESPDGGALRRPGSSPAAENVPADPLPLTAAPDVAGEPESERATGAAAEELPWPLPPELLRLPEAKWTDVAARDVVDEIARKTGLTVRITPDAERVLNDARVTLDLADVRGSVVLGFVLEPHDLGFTVRDGELRIFDDDD